PAPTQAFNSLVPILGDTERLCLEVLLKNYGRHPEVWMSPFLRKLSDALPRLADFERKALLTTLEAAGAIRIEKRRGEPYDYSIILVNYNHPTIRELVGPS
ncbi:MAG: NYN domain-containing protein, partial [Bacteroidota bacterium]